MNYVDPALIREIELQENDVCTLSLPAWQEYVETSGVPNKVSVIEAINCAIHAVYVDGSLPMPVKPSELAGDGVKPAEREVFDEFGMHITAVFMVESGLRHFEKDGSVVTGDGLKAVGIGQLHPMWAKHFGLDRDLLRDNVEMCARLLLRGGWLPKDRDAQAVAFSYYNTGRRRIYYKYCNKVWTAITTIESTSYRVSFEEGN